MSITYVILAVTGFIGSLIAVDEFRTAKEPGAKSE